MSLEVSGSAVTCARCGVRYTAPRGKFNAMNAPSYKGIGRLTICKKCVDVMYESYLSICNDTKLAVRQMCRKLDVFWSESVYEYAQARSHTQPIMQLYLAKINSSATVLKSYDDTLSNEGTLWDFTDSEQRMARQKQQERENKILNGESDDPEDNGIPSEVVDFWGPGYTAEMYSALEKRRKFWMARFPEGADIDIGTEALIRQICNLEIVINREGNAGRQIDKYVNTLNTLLGSAMLRPAQKQSGNDSGAEGKPLGVLIRKWEDSRPIPECDESLKDVDGIKKYVSVWFLGHLAKMLGLKKAETALYDREIEKLRVERPEFDDEDDEAFITDILSEVEDGDSDE